MTQEEKQLLMNAAVNNFPGTSRDRETLYLCVIKQMNQ